MIWGLLSPMTDEEVVTTLVLQSLTKSRPCRVSRRRSFRSPHHTASAVALVGGGRPLRPGEISLAHNGVLFLDELPEYARPALEALREPLESGTISVARAEQSIVFPARFQLVAAMNPCPCGFAGDLQKQCRCTPGQVQRYRQRISGPFLDRLDIRIELGRSGLSLDQLIGGNDVAKNADSGGECVNETTAMVRERVHRAMAVQLDRSGMLNAHLGSAANRHWCKPDDQGRALLEAAATRFGMSARACGRCLRVARTIADLDEVDMVCGRHVAEALSLRIPFYLAGLFEHVVHRGQNLVIRQVGATALGWHIAGSTLVAVDSVLAQRVISLRDARSPDRSVACFRRAGNARTVAGHTGLVIDLRSRQHGGDGFNLGDFAGVFYRCTVQCNLAYGSNPGVDLCFIIGILQNMDFLCFTGNVTREQKQSERNGDERAHDDHEQIKKLFVGIIIIHLPRSPAVANHLTCLRIPQAAQV